MQTTFGDLLEGNKPQKPPEAKMAHHAAPRKPQEPPPGANKEEEFAYSGYGPPALYPPRNVPRKQQPPYEYEYGRHPYRGYGGEGDAVGGGGGSCYPPTTHWRGYAPPYEYGYGRHPYRGCGGEDDAVGGGYYPPPAHWRGYAPAPFQEDKWRGDYGRACHREARPSGTYHREARLYGGGHQQYPHQHLPPEKLMLDMHDNGGGTVTAAKMGPSVGHPDKRYTLTTTDGKRYS